MPFVAGLKNPLKDRPPRLESLIYNLKEETWKDDLNEFLKREIKDPKRIKDFLRKLELAVQLAGETTPQSA